MYKTNNAVMFHQLVIGWNCKRNGKKKTGYVDPAIPAGAGGTGGALGQKFNSHDNL